MSKLSNMQKELQLLLEIENSTGEGSQKKKQELIAQNLTPELEYILAICFDPFITTKLHKLEFEDNKEWVNVNLFLDFKHLCEELKNAPAINDNLRAKARLLVERSGFDLEVKKVLAKVLTKRMNIGIGAKLINKAVKKELIPDPSLMLAEDDHKVLDKWDSIVCEEKYDGVRVICIIENRIPKFYTRAFNELDTKYLQKIADQLLELSGELDGIFFDGELTDFDRKSVSGKVTQIMKGSPKESIGDDLLFNIFDTDPSGVIKKGKGSNDYRIRRGILESLFGGKEFQNIKLATKWEAKTKDELMPIYEQIVANGGEGVIMKDPLHVYECKRSKNWIKFKEVEDCDLEIVGWYPGEGKREGFIGGFICRDLSMEYHVKVGSGFTEADLIELSKSPDSHLGKIVTIQYNVPIEDKKGFKSLFLPRFIEIRSDKTQAENLVTRFNKKK
jgi:ATP-dependent DNA ligase